MSDGQVFTKNTKKFLVIILCDTFKFKGFLNLVRKRIFNIVVNMIDKFGDKYIPDKFDPKLNEIANLCGTGKWEEAALIVGRIANGKIKLPGSKTYKTKTFENGTMFIASLIEEWIDKKKK